MLGIQDVVPIYPGNKAFILIGEISTFVALDMHSRGIGRSLSQATFRAANKLGFLKLHATIRADNPQALAFYQSQGFETVNVARKHAYVRGCFIDEIIMEKWLTLDATDPRKVDSID